MGREMDAEARLERENVELKKALENLTFACEQFWLFENKGALSIHVSQARSLLAFLEKNK